MKAISPVLIAVIFVVGILLTALTVGVVLPSLAAPVILVDFDGQFDLAKLPTDGNFVNSFNEQTACNVSSNDETVGENYQSCIYRRSSIMTNTSNLTEMTFSIMIEIENGPVEDMTIDMTPQTSGTCKPGTTGSSGDEKIIVRSAKLYNHEDGQPTTPIRDFSEFIDNGDEIDGATTGNLAAGEYVLVIEWAINTIGTDCVLGDDLYKLDASLSTDGETDDLFILIES